MKTRRTLGEHLVTLTCGYYVHGPALINHVTFMDDQLCTATLDFCSQPNSQHRLELVHAVTRYQTASILGFWVRLSIIAFLIPQALHSSEASKFHLSHTVGLLGIKACNVNECLQLNMNLYAQLFEALQFALQWEVSTHLVWDDVCSLFYASCHSLYMQSASAEWQRIQSS